MALIYNALTLFGIDIYWQQFVVGAVLIIAVIIDSFGQSDKFTLKRPNNNLIDICLKRLSQTILL
jgi:ribose/xylose/arabinose/galactoside ABC-type transport system permease subunit